MERIIKNNTVMVIAGRDKGKTGKVLRIIRTQCKAIVEGINIVKKTIKSNPQQGKEGAIIEKEAPIHLSNLVLVNPATGKADKMIVKRALKSGKDKEKNQRYFKSNNELVDV